MLDGLPEGLEIVESVNGIVSVAKARVHRVSEDELAAVRQAVPRRGMGFPVKAKDDMIIVYEWLGGEFTPCVRFRLEDQSRRTFSVERMVYRGSPRWHGLYYGELRKLARLVLPKLGTDAFFELV